MREYRAPKGWIHMGTNDMSYSNQETKQERVCREKKFDDAIRSMKPAEFAFEEKTGSMIPTGLKKEGDEAAVAKRVRKDNLMTAFAEKKLKSKALIREAQGYNKKKQGNKQTKSA